jgi:poly-gamma-glutamate capsule biosynthesis protein CapA/YwtB (metallophosphatase superfamily)
VHCIVLLLIASASQPRVSFCAVGDILLDRGIRRTITEHGVDYPFELVAPFINGFDLAFCNLECPVSSKGTSTGKVYCFRADTHFFAGARNAGFDVFSLANNHIIDWGLAACLDTRDLIERHGLVALGVGKTDHDARTPRIVRKNGLTFAFAAYVGKPLAGMLTAGPARVSCEEIINEIEKVRTRVDFVIISMHWGTEYEHVPEKHQVEWAHRLIDAGADLVIGHHPHVLQSIEIYKERPILYSLGNFVFDQHKLYQRQSGVFSCVFRKGSIDSVMFHPVVLEDFRPGIATDSARTLILSQMSSLSQKFSTNLLQFEDHCFLADSSCMLQYDTPLAYACISDKKVMVYRDGFQLRDSLGAPLDSYIVTRYREIRDCCAAEDSMLRIVAIIHDMHDEYNSILAYYTVSDEKIAVTWYDRARRFQPCKVLSGDINGDARSELCVAVHENSSALPAPRQHLAVYEYGDSTLIPVWLSPALNQELVDFRLADIDDDALDDLLLLEKTEHDAYRIVVYQWLGYGFSYYKMIASDIVPLRNTELDLLYTTGTW